MLVSQWQLCKNGDDLLLFHYLNPFICTKSVSLCLITAIVLYNSISREMQLETI